MTASYSDSWTTVYATDALSGAKLLEPESIHTIVTSPPYWGLRSYLDKDHPDKERELGTESTPEAYVEKLVEIFRALRDVLRDDGTLWLNLGSSYANNGLPSSNAGMVQLGEQYRGGGHKVQTTESVKRNVPQGFKPKDLIPIPWLVGLALQRDGWYLRADNIWAKPNPMPSSVTDRPTMSHEYMLLFSKKPRYFFDQEAVREKALTLGDTRYLRTDNTQTNGRNGDDSRKRTGNPTTGRNIRSVWTIATRPFSGSHYACFPLELVYPCIKAGTSEKGVCGECGAPWVRVVEREEVPKDRLSGKPWLDSPSSRPDGYKPTGLASDHYQQGKTVGWQPSCTHNSEVVPATVLDPFMGSGTTAYAARKLGRRSVGFDLDERNLKLIEERLGFQEVLL